MTAWLLIAANLLPLAGVVFFDWSVYEIVLLFWAENLVVGFYTLARMVVRYRHNGDTRGLLMMPFFCFHYGLFTLGHLIFVIALFRPEEAAESAARFGIWIPLLALLLSHGVSFFSNFIGRKEYRDTTAKDLMTAPYGRLLVLHITIVVGGMVVMALGEPLYALTLLVVLKIALDVIKHVRDHARSGKNSGSYSKDGSEQDSVFRSWD